MNKKGNAFVWITGVFSVIAIAIGFLTTVPVLDALDENLASNLTAEQNTTYHRITSVHNWWPALALIGVIIWVFASTVRTDTYGGRI